jgi:sensor domain CHASE-containing protein
MGSAVALIGRHMARQIALATDLIFSGNPFMVMPSGTSGLEDQIRRLLDSFSRNQLERPLERVRRMVEKSRVLFVCTECSESTVSVPAKTTPLNGRIGDMRCVATTKFPQLRADAASAAKVRSGAA